MDSDVMLVPADDRGGCRRRPGGVRRRVPPDDRARLFAIVATAGTTNAGVIDDLAAAAEVCAEMGVWFHVDGAYGAAGLAAPSVRDRFAGIEHADSLIVDPHKWLFAPFDSCALLYRQPQVAKSAHTQHAEYLEVLHEDDDVMWGRDVAEGDVERSAGPTGTPATTPTTCRGAPVACRSGSASPRTAPTPTASRRDHAPGRPRRRRPDPLQRRTASWWWSPSSRSSCSAARVGPPSSTRSGASVSSPSGARSYVDAWHGETVLRYLRREPTHHRRRHRRHRRVTGD